MESPDHVDILRNGQSNYEATVANILHTFEHSGGLHRTVAAAICGVVASGCILSITQCCHCALHNVTTRVSTIMFYQIVGMVIVLVGLTVADRKSSKFVTIKSRDGEDFCAVDVPTAVEWYPANGSDVQCGLECQRRIDCKAFNFNSLLGKCDQYEKTPTNFSVIPDCKGYAFESINDCLLNNGGCAANANCSHKGIDLTCSCAYGWKLKSDGLTCTACNFDYIPATNMYIKVIFEELSWYDAVKRCLDYCPSSHLVVFRRQQEYDSLIQFMMASGINVKLPCGNGNGYWTAKRRLNISPTTLATCLQSPFVWDTNGTTDGMLKEQIWESTQWAAHEPSCRNVYNSWESYVAIYSTSPMKFNDLISSWPVCPLCQLDAA